MNTKYARIISLVALMLVLFSATIHTVLADASESTPVTGGGTSESSPVPNTNGGGIIPLQNPLKADSIAALMQSFLDVISYILVLVGVLALVFVGLQFILARGKPDAITEAKARFFYIIIGLAVVIGARVIVDVVFNTFKATGTINPSAATSIQRAISGQ